MSSSSKDINFAFKNLLDLMQKLRSEQGCAWNKQQTHQTLKPYLIEEAFELLEAIDEGDKNHLKEELGDVLYQVIFHAQIAKEAGLFDIYDVLQELGDKLINRHPHVFTHPQKLTLEEVRTQWLEIKKKKTPTKRFIDVAKGKHSLSKALYLQEEAAKVGFDWPDASWTYDKVREELDEIHEASVSKTQDDVEDEIGDLLFAAVSLARALKVDPTVALERASHKFATRFQVILDQLEDPIPVKSLDEWIQLWKNAKKSVSSTKTLSL